MAFVRTEAREPRSGLKSLCEKRRNMKISPEKKVQITLTQNQNRLYANWARRKFWQFVFHTGSLRRFDAPCDEKLEAG